MANGGKNLRHHKIIVDQWGISQLKVSMFQERYSKRKSKEHARFKPLKIDSLLLSVAGLSCMIWKNIFKS